MNLLERLSNLWKISGLDLTAQQAEQMRRVDRFRKAWDAYAGRMPKPLKVKPGATDDNVLLNFSRVIVDKGVSWLFGQDVTFALGEAQAAAQAWLDDAWRRNRQMTMLQNVALNGAVCGQAFVKLAAANAHTAPYPRLVVLDPGMLDVETQADDLDAVTRYTITWPKAKDTLARQIIEPAEMGGGWQIRDEERRMGLWIPVGTDYWPHEFAPIVHCQNLPAPNEFWGLADLEDDLLSLNNSINFSRSNMARILKYHAHPKTWGAGFAVSDLKAGVDDVLVLTDPNAKLANLEMQSDLASSRDFARDLESAMHAIARVPEIAAGKVDGLGQLSGVALRVLYAPLIEKTETKRRLYGEMLETLCRRLLALGGFDPALEIAIGWPELLPGDPLQERQVAVLDQQLGVSSATLLEKLGYEPDTERAQRDINADQMGETMLSAFDQNKNG